MRKKESFDFSKGRHFTEAERERFRRGIEAKLGVKVPRRGRPAKKIEEKSISIFIRIHPRALAWAKHEAKRRGIGYQTFINQTLLHLAA